MYLCDNDTIEIITINKSKFVNNHMCNVFLNTVYNELNLFNVSGLLGGRRLVFRDY